MLFKCWFFCGEKFCSKRLEKTLNTNLFCLSKKP